MYFEIQKMKNGWFLYYVSRTHPEGFGPFKRKRDAVEKMNQLRQLEWYKNIALLEI